MAEVTYLVLAEDADEVAQWAWEGLQRRLGGEVALVTPADLAFAHELTYSWDGRSERSSIRLDDGRTIDGAGVRGVLNRFSTVYTAHWRRLGQQDAGYAESEIHAAVLVWLASLGDVVTNPPTPYWLGGPYLRPQVWRAHAALLGIPVAPVRESAGTLARDPDEIDVQRQYVDEGLADTLGTLTSLRQVVVHRDGAYGDPSPELAAWGRALAAQVGVPLLGLDVGRTHDGAELLADVTVQPDLRLGGEALLDSIAGLWSDAVTAAGPTTESGRVTESGAA